MITFMSERARAGPGSGCSWPGPGRAGTFHARGPLNRRAGSGRDLGPLNSSPGSTDPCTCGGPGCHPVQVHEGKGLTGAHFMGISGTYDHGGLA
jgi:hypothetical protein